MKLSRSVRYYRKRVCRVRKEHTSRSSGKHGPSRSVQHARKIREAVNDLRRAIPSEYGSKLSKVRTLRAAMQYIQDLKNSSASNCKRRPSSMGPASCAKTLPQCCFKQLSDIQPVFPRKSRLAKFVSDKIWRNSSTRCRARK